MSGLAKFLFVVVILLGVLYLLSTEEQKDYYRSQLVYYKNKLKSYSKKAANEIEDAVGDVDEVKDTIAE